MHVIQTEGRVIKAWVDTKWGKAPENFPDAGVTLPTLQQVPNIEDEALEQLRNMATLPFIHKNGLAVMPDVHKGIGATVGSVVATRGAIVPAAVGVDIGCGMNAVRLSLKAGDLPDSLTDIRARIENTVPVGFGAGSEHRESIHLDSAILDPLVDIAKRMAEDAGRLMIKAGKQLGSLGSGNHFIEICLDEEQHVWVMLHSGSRGVGNIIGRHYITKAKTLMERYFITLPDSDLAYLADGTQEFEDYTRAVAWAQAFAFENRRLMMQAVLGVLRGLFEFTVEDEGVNCHHNYIAHENHFGENLYVTRKGAVRAREGDRVIIPGSMGAKSYIARGKGNRESYCSCSHGAGRVMSRTEARKTFKVEDLVAQTAGVECRKENAVLDEIPAAYKNIDQVMANQSDLVEIEHTLKQILCVKGS